MAGGAAASRKVVPIRVGARVFGADEESRALLQERLIVLSKVFFVAFIALILGMLALYGLTDTTEPKHQWVINVMSLIGVALLTVIWRVFLARKKLSLRTLYGIDHFYAFGTGSFFAAAAWIAGFTLATSGWINLLWSCFTVFLRVIIVPSTGRRTAVSGALLFTPMVVASFGLRDSKMAELPDVAFVLGAALIGVLVISLAVIGSRLIYQLRSQVNEAMRLGQYTLGEKIGEGGNGSVYRAHHALLRRPTAIKVVHPEKVGQDSMERFEREVQAMSQLTHWNTVAIYDYGHNSDGVFYYAMEYLDGINLENLVIDHGLVPSDRVIAILGQVCAALNEAHRRGIIHRDIKPANVILCERGDVPDVAKVVDFGLAKEIDSSSSGEDSTQSILGTPAYIAPEAVTDPKTIGPGADIYALGCVGYFLLTGRRPFEAKTTVEMCIQHVTATPKPLSQMTTKKITVELEQLILRCLAKKPDERPATAAELAKLLREIPAATDWSEPQATTWWSDFRKLPKQAASSAPTMTITVDIDDRVAPQALE